MRTALVAALGILLLAAASLVAASSFSLSPLGVSIRPNDSSSSITARNRGDAPIVIQVRAYAWSQDAEGVERRDETQELIVNPSVFRIAPGEDQLVRIGSRTPAASSAERAYRLVFAEVLPKDRPGGASELRMSLAMDIPLYIEPAGLGPAGPVDWTAKATPSGVRIVGTNPGGRHVRFTDVVIRSSDGKEIARLPHLVVLARSKRSLDLEPPPQLATPNSLSLSASDDSGTGPARPVSFEIPVAPRN